METTLNRARAIAAGIASFAALGAQANPPELTQAATVAARASSSFGIDLYRALAAEAPDRNVFFSPYSMSIALTMAAEGAREETELEMARLLHAPSTRTDRGISALHPGYAELAARFRSVSGSADAATRERIARLKADLETANSLSVRLQNDRQWSEASQAQNKAETIARELNSMLGSVDRFDLRVANALWVERAYPLLADYTKTVERFYGIGGVTPLNFSGQAEQARQTINQWVERNTEQRIRNLIPMGALDAQTRLVITNAVYFLGQWADPFSEGSTKDEDFRPAAGPPFRVKMMKGLRYSTPYAAFDGDGTYFDTPRSIPKDPAKHPRTYPDDGGFTMVSLAYKGGDLSMVLIAPRSAEGLGAIEGKLSASALDSWLARLSPRTVDTAVPRFKMEFEREMSPVLSALGMKSAFINPLRPGGARFSGISASESPEEQLFIGAVLHKAWVEVNERGTEAAAATAVMMPPAASAVRPEETVPFTPQFHADRPFLFLIRDGKSGAVLFMGRVVRPATS